MRNKILMYLFIFSLLFTIFIYVNDKKILDSKQEKIEILETKLAEAESGLEASGNSTEEEYFTLEGNEAALTYFENKGIDPEGIIFKIEDAILSKNNATEDNPIVPMDGMDGVMRINQLKVLNHKWVIADFTDGKHWGEVILSYDISEDGTIEFYSEKSFIYPQY
ncbi:hypothetical protein [Christiangramia sp. SM2212]|uniref:Hydrolase n=1 Tax=Christiangramia sediminicola TaxID=3073267 RepID=A0ABU1ENZ7_9FLAO|nr:hypothetical protein [Christiangramia sp. SM2212]MDR5590110.1 hypothetical protein [Christiangramia sp. SM2212]